MPLAVCGVAPRPRRVWTRPLSYDGPTNPDGQQCAHGGRCGGDTASPSSLEYDEWKCTASPSSSSRAAGNDNRHIWLDFVFFTYYFILKYFQGPVKKARSGYNAKAMAEIRNSLRPFEESSGQPNGQLVNGASQLLGAASGRPLSSLSYNECIQALVNLGFDEVGCHTHSTFFCVEHINMMKCVIWWGFFTFLRMDL